MRLIAVRRYDLDGSECVDVLHKRGRVYALHMTGGGEPERWQIISEAAAAAWLEEAPEQLAVFG